MNYKIIPTPGFEKELKHLAKRYSSLKQDITALINSLIENPIQGNPIYKNCYKIRFSIRSKGKGKSGGGRLITYVKIQNNKVYLLSVFDKSDQDTIADKTIKKLPENLENGNPS